MYKALHPKISAWAGKRTPKIGELTLAIGKGLNLEEAPDEAVLLPLSYQAASSKNGRGVTTIEGQTVGPIKKAISEKVAPYLAMSQSQYDGICQCLEDGDEGLGLMDKPVDEEWGTEPELQVRAY